MRNSQELHYLRYDFSIEDSTEINWKKENVKSRTWYTKADLKLQEGGWKHTECTGENGMVFIKTGNIRVWQTRM